LTRVDFYQIESDEEPMLFACRLIDKVYRKGHQIYIHTQNEQDCSALDELLWTFRPERFIPHSQSTSETAAPIKIGCLAEPEDHQDVLINIAGQVPDFFSRFERVAEIVPRSETSRDQARTNFRFYKERGYPLKYHKVAAQ
jgi:DNA polymerase III subunit chi